MKTQLVLFDSYANSKNGVIRGSIALLSIFLLDMIWFKFSTSIYKGKVDGKIRKMGAFIAWFFMACALSVQNPKSLKEAIVYGANVGLVIYAVFNGTTYAINKNWDIKTSLYDTAWGITNCAITSAILFKFTNAYD